MRQLRILFLGASRLVGLLERFLAASRQERLDVRLLSVEDELPWHAIAVAGVCRVFSGPKFSSKEFEPFLLRLVESENVDIVIPNVDPATVALAGLKEKLTACGISAVVSSLELCRCMMDKAKANELFRHWNVPIPTGNTYPLLAKPRFGSSSRGMVIIHDQEEYDFWKRRNNREVYVVQPYIEGREYSIDAYVSHRGVAVGVVARVRNQVSGGEVMVTTTEKNSRVLDRSFEVLKIPGWFGPLTIQIMEKEEECYVLECNPRFGSGAPCSIQAGLDMPGWILREHLGLPLPKGPIDWASGLCMTRCRKDYFIWLS